MNARLDRTLGNNDPKNVRNHSSSRNKPWTVENDRYRSEKIDRLATQIMTEEAMKIISEAYDAVFEGMGSKRNEGIEDNTEPKEPCNEQGAYTI